MDTADWHGISTITAKIFDPGSEGRGIQENNKYVYMLADSVSCYEVMKKD